MSAITFYVRNAWHPLADTQASSYLRKFFTPLAVDFCRKVSRSIAVHSSTRELFWILAAAYGKLPALLPKHKDLMDGGW